MNIIFEYDTCDVWYMCVPEFNLGRYVEPMVWHYTPAECFQLTPGYYCYFVYITFNFVWSILRTAFSWVSFENKNA
jgi:hypothetical protein